MFINHEYPYHVLIQFAQKKRRTRRAFGCVLRNFSSLAFLWEERKFPIIFHYVW